MKDYTALHRKRSAKIKALPVEFIPVFPADQMTAVCLLHPLLLYIYIIILL